MTDFPGAPGKMCDWETVQGEPGIREALADLSPQYHIVLATNAKDSNPEEIYKALARAGLERYFKKIYCFRTTGHLKPSKAFFRSILTDLNMAVEDFVMVGDDFENDVLGANSCGIYAIWYNRRSAETRNGNKCTTIHGLKALPEILNTISMK